MYTEESLISHFVSNTQFADETQVQLDNIAREIEFVLRETGKVIPFNIVPHVLGDNRALIERSYDGAEQVLHALQKIRKEFIQNDMLKQKVRYPDYLIPFLKNTDTIHVVGSMRFDVMLSINGNPKFIELNSDYPDGIVAMSGICRWQMGQTYLEHMPPQQAHLKDWDFAFFDSFTSIVAPAKDNVIGLIAPDSRWWVGEFNATEKLFASRGYDCLRIKPNKLDIHSDGIYQDGKQIGSVRKCTESPYLFDKKHGYSEYLRSYEQHSFTMYNSLADRFLGYKTLFAILTDPKWSYLFTTEEQKAIAQYVPWTRLLVNESSVDVDGTAISSIIDYIISEKDNFVIKPAGATDGAGVCLGKNCTPEEWQDAVSMSAKAVDSPWIVQHIVESEKRPALGRDENGKWRKEMRYFDLLFYFFGMRDGTLLRSPFVSRSSQEQILNVSKGGSIHFVV